MKGLPTVVYVAGYGRSGSTVLDMAVSRHPEVFGAGELNRLFDSHMHERSCSCGSQVDTCSLWSRVYSRFQTELPAFDLDEASRLTRWVERARRAPRWLTGGMDSCGPGQAYGRIWRTVLEHIQKETGAAVVLDSSKTGHASLFRPLALSRLANAQVVIIHLVRDVRGVIWSFRRGSNERLETGGDPAMWGGALRPVLGWAVANAGVHVVDQVLGTKSLRVRYEDFALQPPEWTNTICQMLGLPELVAEAGSVPMESRVPDHGIGGNRLRRRGIENIRLDEEWKRGLSTRDRTVAGLAWPLQKLYGY